MRWLGGSRGNVSDIGIDETKLQMGPFVPPHTRVHAAYPTGDRCLAQTHGIIDTHVGSS